MRHKLAQAWEEGFAAGRGRSTPAPIPRLDRRHWTTAFQAGAEKAKRDVRASFSFLESSINWYVRYPEPDSLISLKNHLARVKEALRLGTDTIQDRQS